MTIIKGVGLFPLNVVGRDTVTSIALRAGSTGSHGGSSFWTLLVGYGDRSPTYAHGGFVIDKDTDSGPIRRLQEWCGFVADGQVSSFLREAALA